MTLLNQIPAPTAKPTIVGKQRIGTDPMVKRSDEQGSCHIALATRTSDGIAAAPGIRAK